MISARAAKRYANAHLRAEGSTYVATQAAIDHDHGVRVVSYGDPARPGEQLTGGALVVTDAGEVHSIGSAPGEVGLLLDSLAQPPSGPVTLPWPEVLGAEMADPSFRRLLEDIERERDEATIYPAACDVFAAFDLTPYDDVRVVILGQDPYHQHGQATGLCFSVPRHLHKLPPSLRNIHRALENAGFGVQLHGDLTGWAEQGVLLLNTALTVRASEANSHAQRWAGFTDTVIRKLDEREDPIVFVLWGEWAQRKAPLISEPHHVVTAPHPASRGQAQQVFREGETFTSVNEYLDRPVQWALR